MILEKVRNFVEEECKKSLQGIRPFNSHFIPVVNYSKILAGKFGADKEIVEIAAWLHDIGSIIHGRENHHITSSEIAEKKLNEFGYDKNKIEIVKKCIFNHRGSTNFKKESKEEQIIAEADALSHFEDITGIFLAGIFHEGKDKDKIRNFVLNKLKNSFNKLSIESQKIIKPKMEAVNLLLG